MCERCDPALGPGNYNIIRDWTLSRSAHLVTPYPRKLVQLPLILPSHEKQIKLRSDQDEEGFTMHYNEVKPR